MRHCLGQDIQDLLYKTLLCAIVFAAMAATCGSATDPLADLKAGAAALEAKKYPAAVAALEPTVTRVPKIADYAAFFLASAKFELADYAAVAKTLDPVFKMTPVSPLAPRAVLLAARAYGQNGDAKGAIDILRKNYSTLPQPAGDLAMADGVRGVGRCDQRGGLPSARLLWIPDVAGSGAVRCRVSKVTRRIWARNILRRCRMRCWVAR